MLKAPGEAVLTEALLLGHFARTVRIRLKPLQLDQPFSLQQGVEVQIRG